MENTIIENAKKTVDEVKNLSAEQISAHILDRNKRKKFIESKSKVPLDSTQLLQYDVLWMTTFMEYLMQQDSERALEVMSDTQNQMHVDDTFLKPDINDVSMAYFIGAGLAKSSEHIIINFCQEATKNGASREWVAQYFKGVFDNSPGKEEEILKAVGDIVKDLLGELDKMKERNYECTTFADDVSKVAYHDPSTYRPGTPETIPASVKAFMIEVAALPAPATTMCEALSDEAYNAREVGHVNCDESFRQLLKLFKKHEKTAIYKHIFLLNFTASVIGYAKDRMKANQLKEFFLNWLRSNPK